MEIMFACPTCGAHLAAPDHAAGQEVKCAHCGVRMLAPINSVNHRPSGMRTTAPSLDERVPTKLCVECREKIRLRAEICPNCGVRQPRALQGDDPEVKKFANKKIAAGVCGIFLGALGIHKFILGLEKPGKWMLCLSVFSFGVVAIPMALIGLVEGIVYLTKDDVDFYETYGVEKKEWF